MRREITALLIALAAGVCSAQMPPNSFLVRPSDSASGVAQQARQNPVVMDRYARHFQMTPDQVVTMLSSLRLDTIKQDAYYDVYNVPSSTGEIRSRKLLVKKGTKVLVDANGTPVIWLACGNPMTRTDTVSMKQSPTALSGPMDVTSLSMPKTGPVETNLATIQPTAPITPDVTFTTPPPTENIVSSQNNSGAPFAGLAGLGLLPTLLIGLGGGGGNVIPEPTTIILLGSGVAMLAARIRRRAR